ncbi:MAG: hypothetical protein MZW92_41460 [Comamonadaceae bacterium]|nr:hypothetical protein [Comamonadaceae bacterium]
MGVYSVVAIAIRPLFGRMIDLRGGRRLAIAGGGAPAGDDAAVPSREGRRMAAAGAAGPGRSGLGVSMTATIAMCSDLAPADRLAKTMGVIGVAGLVANAVGPLLAEELLRGGEARGGCTTSVRRSWRRRWCACCSRAKARAGPEGGGGRSPGGLRTLRAVPWVLAAIVAGMPVFHGAIRGAMIYFVAVFGHSVGIARVGTFFLVFRWPPY